MIKRYLLVNVKFVFCISEGGKGGGGGHAPTLFFSWLSPFSSFLITKY